MHNLIQPLQKISFFQHFSQSQLEQLVQVGNSVQYPAQTTLFEQGDEADSLYVILEGSVKVFGQDPSGQSIELSTLGTGAFFGELALVDGGTRSATIITEENAEFFVLNRLNFLQILGTSPDLLSHVLADISSKIRSSNEKVYKEMLERQKVQSEMEIERHRSLSQMVAGVAHEINTPLGIVNVSASMITENLTPEMLDNVQDEDLRMTLEDITEAAQLMQSNIARANKLIQTFKSISVSQITDTLEEGIMAHLLAEVVDLFKIKAKQSGISIEIQVEEGLSAEIWKGYPGYLSQVMLNLLTNIDRYAYPDGVGGKVDIRLRSAEGPYRFLIEVEDYGQGMPEEDAARVFDVFFTRGRSKGGTGLGMSIVHNLVTSPMQGNIFLKSVPGEGTRVSVLLPAETAEIANKEHSM